MAKKAMPRKPGPQDHARIVQGWDIYRGSQERELQGNETRGDEDKRLAETDRETQDEYSDRGSADNKKEL